MQLKYVMTLLFIISGSTRAASQEQPAGILEAVGIRPNGAPIYALERSDQVQDGRLVPLYKAINATIARRDHIDGKGMTVIVMEKGAPYPSLENMMPNKPNIIDSELTKNRWKRTGRTADDNEADRHKTLVCSFIAQIAPGAKIVSLPAAAHDDEAEKIKVASKDALAINLSLSVANNPFIARMLPMIDPENNKLLVQGAGNLGKEYGHDSPGDIELAKHKDRLILVGSISITREKDGTIRASKYGFSNTPGSKELESHFLCAPGKGWGLVAKEAESFKPSDFEHVQGTSFSAPIVTGAVALLGEYALKNHRHVLTAAEAKEILLHSACRTFKDIVAEVFYWDPTDPKYFEYTTLTKKQMSDKEMEYFKMNRGFMLQKFNPSTFGMGILDIENAFLYADIKFTHPDWDPSAIRREMFARKAALSKE